MLKLRRGTVVATDPLTVEVEGERRRAWADVSMVGEMAEGDEVVVNTEALDLDLGSGGFDIVHVNLTRGLAGGPPGGNHVMKLNYTSLQHSVDATERPGARSGGQPTRTIPVLVIPLHGHLAPAAWAAGELQRDLRIGYVQTLGGALPGVFSRDVVALRDRDLVSGHVTAASSYGGDEEAITVIGALDAAAERLGWDAIIAGPGPGMLGSATRLGHGGIAALDNLHSSLALGLPTLLSPRLSSSDPRTRHRGVSHHTQSVLELALREVDVPYPEDEPVILDELTALSGPRHRLLAEAVDLDGYAESGLPRTTMGRDIEEDPLFFAAALAAGRGLARRACGELEG